MAIVICAGCGNDLSNRRKDCLLLTSADPPSRSRSWQCQIDITYVLTTGALKICSKQWHSNYDRNLELFNLDPLHDYNIVKNCRRMFDYGVTIVVVKNCTSLNLNTCELGEAKTIKKTDW